MHIEPYNQNWPELFEKEKARILPSVSEFTVAIEHIGSTSVPGLEAKPIIDMILGVKNVTDLKKCLKQLIDLGYEYKTKTFIAIPDRNVFHRYTATNTGYHVHCVVYNQDFWKTQLSFRDYLRKHPEDAKKYGNLKVTNAKNFKHDRKAYGVSKTELIHSILEKAKKEK